MIQENPPLSEVDQQARKSPPVARCTTRALASIPRTGTCHRCCGRQSERHCDLFAARRPVWLRNAARTGAESNPRQSYQGTSLERGDQWPMRRSIMVLVMLMTSQQDHHGRPGIPEAAMGHRLDLDRGHAGGRRLHADRVRAPIRFARAGRSRP